MKFGKEFSSQMVPEWYETYMDYEYMKTLIKDIHQHKKSKTNKNKSSTTPQTLSRNLTLYRSFSGLTTRNNNYYKMPRDLENPAILVKQNGDDLVSYETEFLLANEDGGEYELVFFKRLDDEFNKVDKFYRSKVVEVLNEAEILNKQMDALIAFRIKVENPQVGFDRSSELTRLASDVAASTAALAASTPSSARSRRKPMDSIDEPSDGNDNDDDGIKEMKVSRKKVNEEKPKNGLRVVRPAPLEILDRVHLNNTRETPRSTIKSFLPMDSIDEPSDDNDNDDDGIKEMKVFRKKVNEEKPKNGLRVARPAPLEILDRVYLNNTRETPRSTIKSFLQVPENVELKFSRRNLTKVEAQLNRAFIEFYQKLRLLKSYSFLNMLAFSKIMKKYDKVSSRQCSKSYIKMVDNSYIGSSDEVTKLIERVEVAFIKHFSNSNRSKGMNTLRPKANREKHRETFSLGFFTGCVISLALALILIIRARHLLEHREKDKYMKTLFPLYSLFAFIVLHMTMYAGNIYYWRKYRVNYAFIFGFKQGTELGYREVLLTGYGLAVLALASVILNLDMDMNPKTHDYKEIIELLPLGVLILLAIVLLCPFNVIYRSSRYFFLTTLFHCVWAPFYKVSLPDFFLADQLTSQVQALRSFQYYICYYGTGDYKVRGNTCKEHPAFKTFLFIIAVIPYTCRLLQCLKRMYEERDVMQGYNGLKYFSTIVAVCMRTAYQLNGNMTWNIIAWISSGIAAICGTYWDFVYDWSLLQRHSSNSWLRDKLLVPYKSVYFGAMALNVLLRFAWMQTVLNIKISFIHREVLTTLTASLEIIRRGIWNFFRLENEHLNNVGKYRAFKSVPLPFNYAEEEDKED